MWPDTGSVRCCHQTKLCFPTCFRAVSPASVSQCPQEQGFWLNPFLHPSWVPSITREAVPGQSTPAKPLAGAALALRGAGMAGTQLSRASQAGNPGVPRSPQDLPWHRSRSGAGTALTGLSCSQRVNPSTRFSRSAPLHLNSDGRLIILAAES